MHSACDALLGGTITTQGRREFYYYGTRHEKFESAIRETMQEFEGYRLDSGVEADPNWKHYFEVLYPSEEDMQRIKNTDVVDVLEQNGDSLVAARPVRHWLYFPSSSSRERFKDAAIKLGYRVLFEPESSEQNQPFGITLENVQSVEPASIDGAVLELFRLGKAFGGEYDGWETEVVKPQ